MWRALMILFRLLRSRSQTTMNGAEFSELLAIAGAEVRLRRTRDLRGEDKRASAFVAIRGAAAARGIDAPDWWINLAIEMAVAALRAGLGKLLGSVTPTMRVASAVLLLLLLGAASAQAQVCEPGMPHKTCTADKYLPAGATVSTQTCPCQPGLQPTRSSGCKCLPAGTTTSTRPPSTSSSTSTVPPGSSTTTSTRPPASSTTTSTSTPRPSTTTTSLPPPVLTGPCRPNGIDVSVRWGKQNAAVYFPRSSPAVQFATQDERDCIEQARMEYDNQLSWTVGDIAPTCAACVDGLRTLAYTRIEVRTPYRGTTFAPRGALWIHGPQGRLYQEPGQCVLDCRQALMAPRVRAAAAARLASAPNLRNYLDVNADLTGPADFRSYPVPPTDVGGRRNQTPVDTRKKFPACGGGNGCVDLHLTHQAHACAAQRKRALLGLGSMPGPECDGVPVPSVAHVIYEAGCGDDRDCRWFRRIRSFDGFQDRTSWAPAELGQIATLQDIVHGPRCWMTAQAQGNAPRSEQCSGQHDLLHALENDGAGWSACYPWDGVEPDSYLQAQGNRVLSPRDLLAMLVARYGVP